MGNKLYINILTNSELTSVSDGQILMDIWTRTLKSFLPEKYGNYEPLRKEFKAENISEVINSWNYPFLVKRKRPRMSGSIFFGGNKIPTHGWIQIVLDYKEHYQDEVIAFFKEVALKFNADFGFIHLMTENEFPSNQYTDDIFSSNRISALQTLSVTTHDLRRNIPNIYWTTVLGSTYVELFGEKSFKSLSSISSCLIEELNNEIFYIQLSESILDLKNDFNSVNQNRETIKKYLNSDAFFNPNHDSTYQYLTPNFYRFY